MPVISARFIWGTIVGRFCETPTQEHQPASDADALQMPIGKPDDRKTENYGGNQDCGERHHVFRKIHVSGGVIMIRARTARWAPMSALMPFRPRASISSSCEPVKVASSPELCTSTNSPSSVATRLKSTETTLSSS